jgi:hypothetical protein
LPTATYLQLTRGSKQALLFMVLISDRPWILAYMLMVTPPSKGGLGLTSHLMVTPPWKSYRWTLRFTQSLAARELQARSASNLLGMATMASMPLPASEAMLKNSASKSFLHLLMPSFLSSRSTTWGGIGCHACVSPPAPPPAAPPPSTLPEARRRASPTPSFSTGRGRPAARSNARRVGARTDRARTGQEREELKVSG